MNGHPRTLLDQRVYFIQSGNENAPIKIGRGADPMARLEAMQTGNPNGLRLLGATPLLPHHVAREAEEFLHDYFRPIWIRREWFRATSDLLAAVGDFCAPENASFWRDHGGAVA